MPEFPPCRDGETGWQSSAGNGWAGSPPPPPPYPDRPKADRPFFLMYLYCINEPAAFTVVRFRIYIQTSLISSLLLDGVPDLHAIAMRRINPVIQKVASPAINPSRS